MAESSFYKINSQGTPLDETEETLIRNRRKPIAISARAILRSGTGHKYWSSFNSESQAKIEQRARDLYDLLFEPESDVPVKTLDLPLGGAVSPIDALSVLISLLTIAGGEETSATARQAKASGEAMRLKTIDEYPDDLDGNGTIDVLTRAQQILNRITGNSPGSLGLHPAVYFYNERGKHSRFLFLAMVMLIADKIRNNDSSFFKKLTHGRKAMEKFLIENKSLIGVLLQNMSKGQRIQKTRDLFDFLAKEFASGSNVTSESAIRHLGISGRVLNVDTGYAPTHFPDDVKSMVFVQRALDSALRCPICDGVLDPRKSVSYDHITRVRDGGLGTAENAQLVHPYCNTGMKT